MSREFKPKPLKPVPTEYFSPAVKSGTVERLNYTATDYKTGTALKKHAYVYLPPDYNTAVSYPVIYCLHGGEGNEYAYLGTNENPSSLKNVFDNMIQNKDVESFIAVAPSYYRFPLDNSDAVSDIENFKNELLTELIPCVEAKYSTHAKGTALSDLKASRDYRAYCGYSMGSLSTWRTFIDCNDYFHYFMPMSGDCWINGQKNPLGAAKLLEETYVASGYKQKDLFIYTVTGDEDIAYEPMRAQIEAMSENSPSFHFAEGDCDEGNIMFMIETGATHDYKYLPLYFYNGLPLFLKKNEKRA